MSFFLRLGLCILMFSPLWGCTNEEQSQQTPATEATQQQTGGQTTMDVTPPEAGSGQIPAQNPATDNAARMISPATP